MRGIVQAVATAVSTGIIIGLVFNPFLVTVFLRFGSALQRTHMRKHLRKL